MAGRWVPEGGVFLGRHPPMGCGRGEIDHAGEFAWRPRVGVEVPAEELHRPVAQHADILYVRECEAPKLGIDLLGLGENPLVQPFPFRGARQDCFVAGAMPARSPAVARQHESPFHADHQRVALNGFALRGRQHAREGLGKRRTLLPGRFHCAIFAGGRLQWIERGTPPV